VGGKTLWTLSNVTYDQHPYTESITLSTLGNITSPFNGRVAGTQDFYLVTSNVLLANTTQVGTFAKVPSMYEVYANIGSINMRANTFITTTWTDGFVATANLATVTYNSNVAYPAANIADSFTQNTYSDWYLPAMSEIQTITNNYVGVSGNSYQPPYGQTYRSSTHLNSRVYAIENALPVVSRWQWTDANPGDSVIFTNNGTAIPVRRVYLQY
jgi:hypothetical protein